MLKIKSLAATFGLLVVGPSAYSSVIDTYGIGARSISLGNSAMTSSSDAYQAYSNPAALTDSDRPMLSLDFLMTDLQLNDLSGLAAPSPAGLPEDHYRASRAQDLRGSSLGINIPLFEGVHFGLAGYMPSDNFGRIWGGTAEDVTYLRYSDRQQRPAIYTALAARLPGGWSIGAGSYYTIKARGILQMSLAQEASAARFQLDMEPVLIPYGGVQWSGDRLKFGLVYRAGQAERSEIATDLAIQFDRATLPFSLQTTLAPFYDPEITRFGASWEGDSLAIYGSVERARWSQFRSPQIQLSGEDIGLVSQAGLARVDSLQDSWAYRTGLEFRSRGFVSGSENFWRFGLEHHSAATSAGETAIVDLNRNVVALGYGLKLLEGVLAENRAARIEFAYQRTFLQEKTFRSTLADEQRTVNAGGAMHTLVGGFQYEL